MWNDTKATEEFRFHISLHQAFSVAICLTSPNSLRIRLLNSFPSMHKNSSPGSNMPHLEAMARAVLMLSPVTMRTVIPALWHFLMASGTFWGRAENT